MNAEALFIPYHQPAVSSGEMEKRVDDFYNVLNQRRSIRHFSEKPVDQAIIEQLILTAGTAPSGAHMQPWTFCAVQDPVIKQKIRAAAEEEEYRNYHGRMDAEWINDLKPLATDWHKPFLETAPWLIIVFRQSYGAQDSGKKQHYYVQESVGIACGFLIAAIHQAGLVTLTHTPSPMQFLGDVLGRPKNEKPFLLLPVGFPADNALVPDLKRKTLGEIAVIY